MSDRFKFRVWDNENECWMPDEDYVITTGGGVCYSPADESRPGIMLPPERVIVRQCTGLKDRHGELIFEGDWLALQDPNGDVQPETVLVEWEDNAGAYPVEIEHDCFDTTAIGWAQQMEFVFTVIGNIHESPELVDQDCRGLG